MAFPNEPNLRGVVAGFPQPAPIEDVLHLSNQLIAYNSGGPRLLYRNPYDDQDIRGAVYRWDRRSYQEIFRRGFTPRLQSSTQCEDDYYNLELFVNGGGTPGYSPPADQVRSVFVSTTRSTSWRPRVLVDCTLYRYEIYAPGGIDAVQTLGDRLNVRFLSQQEISFAGGINPQFIRTALPFKVTASSDSQFPTYTTQWDGLIRNGSFNPNPTSNGWTTEEFLKRLRNPTCPRKKECLMKYTNMPARHVEKRGVEDTPLDEEYKVDPVCRVRHYIECAFNFSDTEEAYLFIADQCLLINYAPGTTDDYIIKPLQSIGDAFPKLKDTIFASGIDAAFTACTNEAYIFRSNIYAHIKFTSYGADIVWGPIMITDGFHSLKNTVFENGIDAAFASLRENEAYIFKGDQYALIDFAPYTPNNKIIQGPKKITESFPSLKGTIFQNGFDAAFSYNREGWLSKKTEAYIFKGDTYALIDYAPGTTGDKIFNGPITPISKGFPSLKGIIPMCPCGC